LSTCEQSNDSYLDLWSGIFLDDFVIFFTKSALLFDRRSQPRTELAVPSPLHFDLETYYPVFVYLIVVIGFAGTTLLLTHVIGPRRRTAVKLMPYESGMDPIGDARQHFDVKYYLIAILFLVFDVELLFLYPWAVAAYSDKADASLSEDARDLIFWEILVFLFTLVIAYIYAWRKGVFRWR
jgi:NADH-quinone oxidoreductase subunit A